LIFLIIFARNFTEKMTKDSYKYLYNIDSPIDLKAVPQNELSNVCDELRRFIIEEVSKNPGHLGQALA